MLSKNLTNLNLHSEIMNYQLGWTLGSCIQFGEAKLQISGPSIMHRFIFKASI